MSLLTEFCRIPTSGARAVEPFEVDGASWLAVPQLATDVPGTPADMNGGDSDTEVLLLRRAGSGYDVVAALDAPGGEDAEFFSIDGRRFLAVASIRSGAGPYDYTTPSRLFEWSGDKFLPYQTFPGYAAKQWRHLEVDGRHFLALAQGLARPGQDAASRPSEIHEWNGSEFVPFQTVASAWGYNWHGFAVDGRRFLAHADHVEPSVLHEWDGSAFVPRQVLVEKAGRAFADFTVEGTTYLLAACLLGPSRLLRWDGSAFVEHQVLDGPGAREWAVVHGSSGLYVVRVNFITGTPQAPNPQLDSQIYRWHDDRLEVVETFPTSGGTDVAVIEDPGGPLIAVSNALSPDVRFAVTSVIYRFSG